jgi:hypothetical protein
LAKLQKGYKINIQKLVAFLYTKNEHIKKKIRSNIPFTSASKTIKYLEINLTKETKKLFNENYKPLERENEEDIRRWKDPSSWISRFKFVRLAIILTAIYIFYAITIKFL